MKDVTNIKSSAQYHGGSFRNEELRNIEHVLYATRRTRLTLDAYYEKSDLQKFASNDQTLTDDERDALHNLLTKY